MAKGVLIAALDFSNAAEDEFNDWYDLCLLYTSDAADE